MPLLLTWCAEHRQMELYRGCYEGFRDTGEGACGLRAYYRVKLASEGMVSNFCIEHTALVRKNWPDDVEWIETLRHEEEHR